MNAKVTPEIEEQVMALTILGHTQTEIAKHVGMSQSHVSKIVRGCHRAKLN